MTEPDDLTRRLDDLGATAPPPPTEAFLAGLDAGRLHRAPEHRARVLRLPVVLPAAAVAAMVLGFVLLAFGGSSEPRTITIVTASDASVLQAERSVPAEQGQQLEEGDHVTTGPAGSVTAGDVTIGPNEEAIVRGGRLLRLRRYLRQHATTTTTAAPTTTTTAAPAGAPRPSTTTTTSTPPTTPPPRAQRDIPVTLELVGRRLRDGSVGLVWTRYDGADFGGYVVVREDRDVIARRPSVDGVRAADRAAPPEPTRYVVVVLDAARQPVARSQVIRL
ncbi:MAG: hypothetical protein JWN67_1326 [Actinomycetia bacterium]|nr:hypothetical protein [Actinomycetes bacterium]